MNRKKAIFQILRLSITVLISAVVIAACSYSKNKTNITPDNDSMRTAPEARRPDNARSGASRGGQTFKAELTGANEVPEVETKAKGSVTAALSADSIHIKGKFSALSSPYAGSHIHKGAERENGDPILTLKPDMAGDKTSGSWEATYPLVEDQIQALKADSLYIDVHSADHESGEIRGQLESAPMR